GWLSVVVGYRCGFWPGRDNCTACGDCDLAGGHSFTADRLDPDEILQRRFCWSVVSLRFHPDDRGSLGGGMAVSRRWRCCSTPLNPALSELLFRKACNTLADVPVHREKITRWQLDTAYLRVCAPVQIANSRKDHVYPP